MSPQPRPAPHVGDAGSPASNPLAAPDPRTDKILVGNYEWPMAKVTGPDAAGNYSATAIVRGKEWGEGRLMLRSGEPGKNATWEYWYDRNIGRKRGSRPNPCGWTRKPSEPNLKGRFIQLRSENTLYAVIEDNGDRLIVTPGEWSGGAVRPTELIHREDIQKVFGVGVAQSNPRTASSPSGEHVLVIDSVYDPMAHCSQGDWHYSGTSSDRDDPAALRRRIRENFRMHLKGLHGANPRTVPTPKEIERHPHFAGFKALVPGGVHFYLMEDRKHGSGFVWVEDDGDRTKIKGQGVIGAIGTLRSLYGPIQVLDLRKDIAGAGRLAPSASKAEARDFYAHGQGTQPNPLTLTGAKVIKVVVAFTEEDQMKAAEKNRTSLEIAVPEWNNLLKLIRAADICTDKDWARDYAHGLGGWTWTTTGGGCTALVYSMPGKAVVMMVTDEAEIPQKMTTDVSFTVHDNGPEGNNGTTFVPVIQPGIPKGREKPYEAKR